MTSIASFEFRFPERPYRRYGRLRHDPFRIQDPFSNPRPLFESKTPYSNPTKHASAYVAMYVRTCVRTYVRTMRSQRASSRLWAEKCTYSHSSTDGGSYADCAGNACGQNMGENLWMSSANTMDNSVLEGSVQDWYDEKPDWTYGSGTYDSSQRAAGKMCGQYTPYHLLRIPPVGLRVYLFLILWARARLYFLFVGVLSWPHF